LRVDIYKESLLKLFICKPLKFITAILKLLISKEESKRFCCKNTELIVSDLPYNTDVINTIHYYKKRDYQIILATGTHFNVAKLIYNHLNIFDDIIASNNGDNIVGENKAKLLNDLIGKDFIYLADSKDDIGIWKLCKRAICVGNDKKIIQNLKDNDVEIIKNIPIAKNKFSDFLRILRIYHWPKNLIIFIPIIASHQIFIPQNFYDTCFAFLSFSMAASLIYIINDISDLKSDRVHEVKKLRPIANGNVSTNAILSILIVLSLSLFYSFYFINKLIIYWIIFYIFLNILYTNYFKKLILFDIIILTTFYIVRLCIGFISISSSFSVWLLSFSIFTFLSLGTLKRYTEITMFPLLVNSQGRPYQAIDTKFLMSLGTSSSIAAVVVLLIYISSHQVKLLYNSPLILTISVFIYLYWISRLWLLANRGLMHSDPVQFAISDRTTYLVVLSILLIMIIAKNIVL
jgi:4-hydroxybenzoate polyprenyltransferase